MCCACGFRLHYLQSNDKENNAPTKPHQHHWNTHDGHYCTDGSCVVLWCGGNSSLLCGWTVQVVWGVELWDCQCTLTWFNEVSAIIYSDIGFLSCLFKRLDRLPFTDARSVSFHESDREFGSEDGIVTCRTDKVVIVHWKFIRQRTLAVFLDNPLHFSACSISEWV